MDSFQLIRLGQGQELLRLIDAKATDINAVNRSSQNLLQEAIAGKQSDLASELITRGIDVNHKDEQGQTPLQYAAVHKDFKTAKALVEKGADLATIDKYGNGPLWTAVFNARGNYDIVALLVANGANPNTKNKVGRSALDFATQIKENDLISLLESRKG